MLDFFMSNAYAQAAPAAGQNAFSSFIPLIAIFFIFYFLMIRPQKKQMEDEKKFHEGMQKGDEVYTKSGMLGKIYGLTEKFVTLELEDGVKVKFLRSHIAGMVKDLTAQEAQKK